MLLALYDLPDIMVYALFMLVSGLMAALACRLGAPLVDLPSAKDHLDIAMRTTAAVVSALTLTLAFCAIQARTQQSEAQRLVSLEVSAISGVARQAARMEAEGGHIHLAVMAYLHSVVDTEFHRMADHGRDPTTQRLAETLEHAVYAAAAGASDSVAADLMEQADDLDQAREERLHAATTGLPRAFWLLIAMLLGLLVATGVLYPPRRHTIGMLGVQAAGVGSLVAFVFLMDQPFRGHLSVSAAPYESLIHSLTHRAEVAAAIRRGILVAEPPPQPEAPRVAEEAPAPATR
ncbi:bestrophin-like domain [Falsiroseomonas selenitidurans]|uniref:DUF4239 domain-containing protein n=1 Tax=Falsiroseomonas selenitidurans TaxID=2716335 RepID=A0ABX1E5P5_9PROT|nr:DUF4239 domain-containing protein [Falsiroseomonas selenitidurans]NKC30250.1 DUF4239 domain-containing protein [Falsiroseomonas selenitidurans]